MTSMLREQLAVPGSGLYWDVGGFRLWQSTVPEIILYVATDLQLAKDAHGRYRSTVTQVQRWRGGSYEVTGGSAILGFYGDAFADPGAARTLEDEWSRVVLNMGYSGPSPPRFIPLPVRDAHLAAAVDDSQVRMADSTGERDSRTLVLDLTAAGARGGCEAYGRGLRCPVSSGCRIRTPA
jgi:hypothetical protein